MSRIWIVSKKQLFFASLIAIMMVTSFVVWVNDPNIPAMQTGASRTIQLVVGEFQSTGADGKKIEVYRWDPGTIVVQQGETIELRILGVNGDRHPFMIEGLNVKGEVEKGKETVVSFAATQRGVFRIICMTHADIAHRGPMVGYIVVQ